LDRNYSRAKKLARRVDIIGVGMSDLGLVTETPSLLNMTTRELWTWAAAEAIADAGVVASDIEALFVGNMIGEFTEGQYHLAYVLSQWTGLSMGNDAWRPAVRVDGACASSSHAIRSAVFAVASGAYDIVLAGGVEISNASWTWQAPGEPRRMSNAERVKAIYGHYDQGWELPNMAMLDHSLSQWLIAYAKHYGLSIEALYDILDARIISNYENGTRNPRAYWNRSLASVAHETGFDDVREFLRSPQNAPTCWPMRQWDGPRRCDGAAALVICAAEALPQSKARPVHYLGTGSALQSSAISRKMYTQPFIVEAGREAFAMAGISPEAVDVVEMYDYGPAEYLIPLEDLGVFERGAIGSALLSGQTLYSGSKPVNPSGGTSCGVVAGTVGSISAVHVVQQLRGQAGANQVNPPPKIGLIYDCGGGRDAVVHLLAA
jgi:acetyl-CoA acetyltransferase